MIPTMLRWTLLTSVGLVAGVAAALILQRPIEALVSPLPSELTTPPVTKMCLVMVPSPSCA